MVIPKATHGVAAATRAGAGHGVAAQVALVCLVLAALETIADALPDGPIAGVLTPLRLVLLVGLAAVVISGLRRGAPWRRWGTPLDAAVVVLLAAGALPMLSTGDWAEWRGLLTSVAFAYLAAGVMRSGPDAWPAITVLALVGVGVMSLTALQQVAGGVPTGFCRGALDGSADSCGSPGAMIRAVGTFANPNLLAAALILLLPLAAAAAAAFPRRAVRLVAYVVVVAGVAGLVLTWSRGGMLAALAAVGAFVVLRRPTPVRLAVGGAVAAAGITGAYVALLLGAPVGVRADVWAAAVGLVRAHPWGVGLGRSGPLLDAAIPGDEAFQHAHNLWLDVLVTSGVLGLAAALAVAVVAAIAVVRAARAGSAAAVALGSALTGFAVFSLGDHPANAVRVAALLWLALGLAVSCARPLPGEEQTSTHAQEHAQRETGR